MTVIEQTSDGLIIREKLGPRKPPPHILDFISRVEDWRTTVGLALGASPFAAGTGLFVLDPTGDRLERALDRLRELLADLDRWIEQDD